MKSDEEVLATQDDVEMIERRHLWPLKTVLPLKRRHEERGIETGVIRYSVQLERDADGRIVGTEEAKYVVYVGANVYGNLGPVEAVQYDSAQAIVDDGWIVD